MTTERPTLSVPAEPGPVAKVGDVLNGVSLAVIAVFGLANGLATDGGVSVWRVTAYPVLAVLAYLQGRHLATRHDGWIVAGVALLALPLAPLVSPQPLPYALWEAVSAWMSLSVAVALPWLAGRSRRQQAALVRAGQREVEQLRREREYVSDRARARERARIATDVHDSLGHALALIALRAGALELSPGLGEPDRLAAEELRASAVKATDRLRETIGMLREDIVPVDPPDETVAVLVDRAVAAGMDVTLSAEPVSLPPLLDRAVHRVVREALTNAARHSPGSCVTVRIAASPTALDVTVANADAPDTAAVPGSGSGLLGLAERVRLLGGEFSAGPRDNGFTVSARLPLEVTGSP